MRVIALTASICFVLASFSGCCDKSVEVVRPKLPTVKEANITMRCDDKNDTKVAKCVMRNYLEVKSERDSLRGVLEMVR
jgi:hypothetical protein